MESYNQHVPILESLYRKPGVNLPALSEVPDILEEPITDIYTNIQDPRVQLYEHISTLQTQNKELEAYAFTVAHDLKEPLAVMILTSNLINSIPNLTRDELKEYLQQIKFTAYQMSTIINTLLLFARVNKAEAPSERVEMALVVANVKNRLSHMIKEHNAQVTIPKFWPSALGHAPWIEEVWANYLSNAIKYGGKPPRVELGASIQPDGMVRYWVRDNGDGLPPEAHARLFTPFSQIGRTSNLGQGLGLSIVLHIIEKLGGQVGFESELGKGSRFFFTLPADTSS